MAQAKFTSIAKTLLIGALFLVGCTKGSEKSIKEEALVNEQGGDYQKALKNYQELIQRTKNNQLVVDYAKAAGQIALVKAKDFAQAIGFFRLVVLKSSKQEERVEAQKNLANIYFSYLPIPDYEKAINEFSKLLSLSLSEEEKFEMRLSLAKSYYRLNNFFQAQTEIDTLLESLKDKNKKYELKKLKADIYLSAKELDKAVETYQDLLVAFPQEAKKDDMALSLAVCYEDQGNYSKSIEVLEGMKKAYSHPEFIELRIKRLRDRRAQQPGSHGLKK
ncbi:MAG: tetratricopeptide repeat protein [Pseudomonadota bacterium]|nr:tetratricopeptide repeat protein [Pseudomonadota bacterium]